MCLDGIVEDVLEAILCFHKINVVILNRGLLVCVSVAIEDDSIEKRDIREVLYDSREKRDIRGS